MLVINEIFALFGHQCLLLQFVHKFTLLGSFKAETKAFVHDLQKHTHKPLLLVVRMYCV